MGLTYSQHIRETASDFEPGQEPPVFMKSITSWAKMSQSVRLPGAADLTQALNQLEAGLGDRLLDEYEELPVLFDYEVELAFVILEEIDWLRIADSEYMPKIGFFVANDLSARTIAILGEGLKNKLDFWGISKSFPGFLPVAANMWVPHKSSPNAIPCVRLVSRVNDDVRQDQKAQDMIYTPKQMIQFAARRKPDGRPKEGDVILMGTPGGVALQVPRWKARLAGLLSIERFTRLRFVVESSRQTGRFLKQGDRVTVSGGLLGSVSVTIR